MATVTRRRTLRPSSRLPDSSYKVVTTNVGPGDILRIEIDHEDDLGRVLFVYEVNGRDVADKDSISFRAFHAAGSWRIKFSGVTPRLVYVSESGPQEAHAAPPTVIVRESRVQGDTGRPMEVSEILRRIRTSKERPSTAQLPDAPGIYGIFVAGGTSLPPFGYSGDLMYVGKAEDSLATRDLRTHFSTGKTGGSTLRRSLGAILKGSLNLRAVPRSPKRTRQDINCYKFTEDGDERLTTWMRAHLEVGFCAIGNPWKPLRDIEHDVLMAARPHPVLDLDPRTGYLNPMADKLEALRAICRQEAAAWLSG